jgi:hypothetical protein
MNGFHENLSTGTASQETGPGVEPLAELDPRALRVCCGSSVAPRLAEIRQPGEPTLFVTVWRCPKCHRVTY